MIDTQLILTTLLHLLPVLYGVAFFNYLLVFVSEEKIIRRLARPLLLAAVSVNLVYLLVYTVYFEHVPLVTVFQVLGAVGFAVAATYLWVESKTGSPYSGPFVLFLVVVFQIVNTEFPKFDRQVPVILESKLFSFHVSAAVLGYSALSVSAVYGLLYLILYRQMRGKRFGLFFHRLPPLDTLDRMNFYAALVGFVFLVAAVVLGSVWSRLSLGTIHFDSKVIVALITIVIYGGSLAARRLIAWRGVRMAYSTLVGFLVVLFSLFGVRLLFESFHNFVG
jgi:ABC-type transport system involved in cytochrome c biogenesis permease subunit